MTTRATQFTKLSRSAPFRYAVSFLATSGAVFLRWVLEPYLGRYTPFITLYPVLAVLAMYFGVGPSVLSTLVGLVGVTYWIMRPQGLFAGPHVGVHVVSTIVYLAFGAVIIVSGEITRRSRMRLERAQSLFQSFLDNSPGAEYLKTEDGVYVYANQIIKRRLSPDPIGKNDFDTFSPAIASQYRENDLLVLQDNKVHEFLEKTVEADGEHIWMTLKFPVFDADGNRLLGGKSIDITEAKRAEEALAAASAQLRQFLDTAGSGLVRCSRGLRYLAANPAYAEIVGRPVDEIVGRTLLEVLGEEGWANVRPFAERALKGEKVEFDSMVRYPNGIARSIHAIFTPEILESGTVVGWVGSITDVSERKQLELELRNTTASLHHFLDTAAAGLVRCSRDLRLLAANPAYAEIIGVPLTEIIGRPMDQVLDRAAWQQMLPRVEEALQGHRTEYEGVISYADTMRHVHAILNPERDSTGEISGFIASVVDISEMKRSDERLRRMEKLAAAGQLAASLAHEINNPLSSVINALYLLKGHHTLDERSAFLVSTADSELQRVARIVRQSLSYYRQVEAQQQVDLAALLEQSLQIFQGKLRHAGIQCTKRSGPIASISGLPDEIRQVVDNLLLNAIEAMSEGGRLSVALRSSRNWQTNQRGVRLTLADTGHGIARADLHKAFEPFFTTKGERGTGLGLWVVRGIVTKHDGTISIRSSQQQGRSGTVISILWPVNGTAAPNAKAARQATATSGFDSPS
jgi:PAS domain S-box-containing protein